MTRDLILGHVFSKTENCLRLLQSILPDLGITEVEVTPQKQLNKNLLEKNVIMDLCAKNKDGKIFDVKMQTTKQKWPGVRFRYYQSITDQDSLKPGEDLDQIRETYIIFIYPFDPFGEGKYIYEGMFLLDKDNPDSQANTKIHWISINARGYKGQITPELKEFLDYIKYGLTKDSSNFIKKIDRERLDYIRSTE
ncbi:Rpn family recombination-promoting nuclease/putative transposase [Lactobacillus helveticus]|uniref:Rpn family recombination-promoting nuclease/putative transposase n=1 Tax=Lactobacillus helveticus TaxID=1587 RepID=UPI0031D7E85B